MNMLVAASASIARSYALIDWGWTLHKHSLSGVVFKNKQQEEVIYLPISGVYQLKGIDKGKLYYVMDGLDRYPNDLEWLGEFMRSTRMEIIRNPADEGKLDAK